MGKPDAVAPANVSRLRNEDVIELMAAGFAEDLIAIRIQRATGHAFDLSTKGLVALKAAGVSERLIALMLGESDPVQTSSRAASAPAGSRSTSPPVPAPTQAHGATAALPVYAISPSTLSVEGREAGIYLKVADAFVALEPTAFSGGKSGGVITSGLTFGIKKAKWNAVVRSARAVQRVQVLRPEFYFYFESRGSGLGRAGLLGATSPNEFVLARMNQKRDERELIVGQFGALGASTGTRSEDTVDLAIERLASGVYRVVPRQPLEEGEYCFFYAGGVAGFMSAGMGKLFDFGIDPDSSPSR